MNPVPGATENPRWRELVLTDMLRQLRVEAEGRFTSASKEYDGSTAKLKEYGKLRARLKQKTSGTTENYLSAAKGFLTRSTSSVIGLLSRAGARDGSEGLERRLAGYKLFQDDMGRVEGALEYDEQELRFVLPDFEEFGGKRWPGPVSYRAALNHFVAVCVRVHSILPGLSFEDVAWHCARRVLCPVLAHNLKFLASHHPEVYRAFVHDDTLQLRQGREIKEEASGIPRASLYAYRKWARLFNIGTSFGTKVWSVDKAGELFMEVQSLLREHEADARSSRLWRELSMLASGDMAVDDMLVSWVVEEVGGASRDMASSPLIACARSRFGLLRYSFGMVREADLLRKDFNEAMVVVGSLTKKIKATRVGRVSDELSEAAFGWAYIISRYLLLGRDASDRLNSEDFIDRSQLAGLAFYDLLYSVYQVESADVRARSATAFQGLLALRYLLGFMSNPRFARPFAKLRSDPRDRRSAFSPDTIKGLLHEAGDPSPLPDSITCLVSARVSLHLAVSVADDAVARRKHLEDALDHYAASLSAVSSGVGVGAMDGEVIAWALPEMYHAVEMAKLVFPLHLDALKDLQRTILLMGEVRFGVYFNPVEECKRIKEGLKNGVGVGGLR